MAYLGTTNTSISTRASFFTIGLIGGRGIGVAVPAIASFTRNTTFGLTNNSISNPGDNSLVCNNVVLFGYHIESNGALFYASGIGNR